VPCKNADAARKMGRAVADTAPQTVNVNERLARARAARLGGVKPSAIAIDGLLKAASLDRPATEIAKIAKRLEDTPETMRRTYLRAVGGKSKAAAIKAFCSECVGWDRQEVRRCTAPACPLFALRPFTERTRPCPTTHKHGPSTKARGGRAAP
jgi:hypothetical protein